jgi:hypothetical protein
MNLRIDQKDILEFKFYLKFDEKCFSLINQTHYHQKIPGLKLRRRHSQL